MAKDPAFLFYPGDWMGGTMVMSRHQKGCYLDLLIAQFNNGPLSLESIKTILGQDQATWTVLSSKFKQDSEGNYYSARLVTEIEKRKQFTESRKLNGQKGGRPPKEPNGYPTGLHMGNLTENRNRDKDLNVLESIEECMRIALRDERWVKSNKTSEQELKIFNAYLEKAGDYNKNPADYKSHFSRWKPKQNHDFSKAISGPLRKSAQEIKHDALNAKINAS